MLCCSEAGKLLIWTTRSSLLPHRFAATHTHTPYTQLEFKISHMPGQKIAQSCCTWACGIKSIFGDLMKFKCLVLATLIPIRNEKLWTQGWEIIKRTAGSVIYRGPSSLAALWKGNVNGTLLAKVNMVIRIQPAAPLIYSQSGVVHLWICSIFRRWQDFHRRMSFKTTACLIGDI